MGTLQQGPRQNNVPFIQKVRLDRLSKQKDRGQQSWPGRPQWAQQVPDSHPNMGSVLNKMGPLECADSRVSPLGPMPQSSCQESQTLKVLYSALDSSLYPGSPPHLVNIWLMGAVQAEPESSFPNPSRLQSSESPPQIRPPDAVLLPLSRPSLPSVRTNVAPRLVFCGCPGQSPHFWNFCSGPPRVKARSQVCPCKDRCRSGSTVTHS